MDVSKIEGEGFVSVPLLLTIEGIECVIRIEVAGTDTAALKRLFGLEQILKDLFA